MIATRFADAFVFIVEPAEVALPEIALASGALEEVEKRDEVRDALRTEEFLAGADLYMSGWRILVAADRTGGTPLKGVGDVLFFLPGGGKGFVVIFVVNGHRGPLCEERYTQKTTMSSGNTTHYPLYPFFFVTTYPLVSNAFIIKLVGVSTQKRGLGSLGESSA